jgi:Ni,Fe-hydrogenase III large subunit
MKRKKDSNEILEGHAKFKRLSMVELQRIHEHVTNSMATKRL